MTGPAPAHAPGPPHRNVLEVRGLTVAFRSMTGTTHAVKGIDLTLPRGRTLALVGESGSGKSVTSFAVLRLTQPPGRITAGTVTFFPKGDPPV